MKTSGKRVKQRGNIRVQCSFFNVFFRSYFSHYHFVPLYTPLPSNHHTGVHVHESLVLKPSTP